MAIVIKIEGAPDEATHRLLDEGLGTYNFSKTDGSNNYLELCFAARDTVGIALGISRTKVFYYLRFIDLLWVAPPARGNGIGSLLMDQAEATARESGYIGAYVDTFSFQAPDFYRRRGHEEFGRLEQLPPGHACIWLRNSL